MIEERCIPRLPTGLIEGIVEGYSYFLNPKGHFGAIVLFGEGLDVLQGCRNNSRVQEIQNSLPWAKEDPSKFTKILTSLAEREFIILDDAFTQQVRDGFKRNAKRQMMVWLQLTDACNLGCEYCYIRKRPARMELPLTKRLVSAIVRDSQEAGFDKVVFKLAGGEPTLCWPIGKSLIDWAEETFGETTPLVRFHIITNGTLLPQSLVDYLRAGKLGISLFLDGVEAWHNKTRRYHDDTGSFKDVDRTIETLLAAGISPQILTTVTDVNVDGLTELAEYNIARDLNFRFSFYRGVITSPIELANNDARLIRALEKCYAWIGEHLPRQSLYVSHRFGDMSLQVPKVRGCGVGVNGMTIATDGQVSTCQYEMANSLGNALTADSVSLILKEGEQELAKSHVDKIPGCQECKWRYICGGGCAFQTKYNYGTFQHTSPYCEVYKAILPIVVELHALQLIRNFKQRGGEVIGKSGHLTSSK